MVIGAASVSMPSISPANANYGKMALPVDPSSLIYSHFEHVSGIPAPEGTKGVSISKLNLLDVLIARIDQMKASGAQVTVNPTEGVDALIENMTNIIREAQFANDTLPYNPSPQAEPGALFSLSM